MVFDIQDLCWDQSQPGYPGITSLSDQPSRQAGVLRHIGVARQADHVDILDQSAQERLDRL